MLTMKYKEQKLRENIPFAVATRKIKYLGINLIKEVKDLYSETYTTLKKQIKEDATNGAYTMIKWDSFQGCKDGTIFTNQ